MAQKRLVLSVAVVATLVAAACGSTVPVQQQEAAEAAAAQGIDGSFAAPGSDGLGSGSGSGSAVGGPGSGIPGSGSGTAIGGGAAGAGAAGAAPQAGAAGANGPGITSSTVKIGLTYTADYDEANTAIGASGATGIDMRRAYNAMIDYINTKSGGFGGRKGKPVFHPYRVTSSSTSDQQDQEACAHWTQDDPVFITDAALKTENGVACLEKAGTVAVATNGLRFKSGAFFERYPHYLEFDGIDNDDLSIMYADSMAKLGLFGKNPKDAKIGLITWDDPEYAGPMQRSLIPRLRQHGLNVADVAYIKSPDAYQDVGEAVAQIGNTAVRFKGEGITHVMFLDSGANQALFFMEAAERQQYRPRYGLTSASGNTALADILRTGGNDQEARNQLHGALAVGFSPTLDARAEDQPAWANTPSKKLCYQIMREGGITMDSANARGIAEGVCDELWTMEATIEAAGKVVNQDTWLAGLDSIGEDDVEPTSGLGLAVGANRHDGNAYAAHLKFYDDCVCFKYISDRFPVPD